MGLVGSQRATTTSPDLQLSGFSSAVLLVRRSFFSKSSAACRQCGKCGNRTQGVAAADLTRVTHDHDLGVEALGTTGRIVLGVGADKTTLDVLNGDVLAVEPDVVTRDSLGERLVVHLHRLNLSGETSRGEDNVHTGLDDTGPDTAHGDCANTADLVDVLEGQTKRLVGGALGGLDIVKSLDKDGALVPGGLVGSVNHVVAL